MTCTEYGGECSQGGGGREILAVLGGEDEDEDEGAEEEGARSEGVVWYYAAVLVVGRKDGMGHSRKEREEERGVMRTSALQSEWAWGVGESGGEDCGAGGGKVATLFWVTGSGALKARVPGLR